MLNPVLRLLLKVKVTAKLIALAAERAVRSKELLHVRNAFHVALLLFTLRHHRDIDHRRRYSRRQRFHGMVERKQRSHTVVIERRRCWSRSRRRRGRRL